MGRGPAVAVVLAAMLASGASSGSEPGTAPAPEPHAGDATANVPAQSPTAAAVPDPPPVLGPGLRRRETTAIRLETQPPRPGPEQPGPHRRDLGTGATAQGASHATSDRLPQPSDAVLGTAASPSSRADPKAGGSLQACVDRALAARGLNGFGDPPATEYPGGTPVDATSLARYDYVLRRSPSIRAECQTTTPFR